jgi:cobalt-zinc-cadmium efflux system outer membrane protein
LRAVSERDREMHQNRFGVTLSIPLWDRKLGPVREAEARRSQADLRIEAETFAVRQRIRSPCASTKLPSRKSLPCRTG